MGRKFSKTTITRLQRSIEMNPFLVVIETFLWAQYELKHQASVGLVWKKSFDSFLIFSGIYEVYAGNKHFHYGKQPDLFPETETVSFKKNSSSSLFF